MGPQDPSYQVLGATTTAERELAAALQEPVGRLTPSTWLGSGIGTMDRSSQQLIPDLVRARGRKGREPYCSGAVEAITEQPGSPSRHTNQFCIWPPS